MATASEGFVAVRFEVPRSSGPNYQQGATTATISVSGVEYSMPMPDVCFVCGERSSATTTLAFVRVEEANGMKTSYQYRLPLPVCKTHHEVHSTRSARRNASTWAAISVAVLFGVLEVLLFMNVPQSEFTFSMLGVPLLVVIVVEAVVFFWISRNMRPASPVELLSLGDEYVLFSKCEKFSSRLAEVTNGKVVPPDGFGRSMIGYLR